MRILNIVFFIVGFLFCVLVQAQSENTLEVFNTPEPNNYKGETPLYGELISTGFILKPVSVLNNDNIWESKYRISAPNSAGIMLMLEDFKLKTNEVAFVQDDIAKKYKIDRTAISSKGNYSSQIIASSDISIIILSDMPVRREIKVAKMALFHKADLDLLPEYRSRKDFGQSDNCNINVACSDGDATKIEESAAVRILLVTQEGIGWCSGGLMNNERQDGTPYILTAFHCQDGYTPFYDMWRFDFNYQYGNCTGGLDEPSFSSITGCVRRAGRLESDFLLLELTQQIPQSFQAYFYGWDRRDKAAEKITLLHHPIGDVKKVTLYLDSVRIYSHDRSINWSNMRQTPAHHHWYAKHTRGMFEVGSSGAPGINHEKRVIGQLHGGNVDCEDGFSYFGKFSRSWDEGIALDSRLKEWLSPDSNYVVFGGMEPEAVTYCEATTVYTDPFGTVTDGSGTELYGPNSDCQFRINRSDQDKYLEIEYNFVELGAGDQIIIYRGPNVNSPVHRILSSVTALPSGVDSLDSSCLIQFLSNDDNDQAQGFEISYTLKDKIITTSIGGTVRTASGVLAQAEVKLLDRFQNEINSTFTDNDGQYRFVGLPIVDDDLFVVVSRDYIDSEDELSLIDVLQLRLYVTGITDWTDPLKMLVGDIDKNGNVDFQDLILMDALNQDDTSPELSHIERWIMPLKRVDLEQSTTVLEKMGTEEFFQYRVNLTDMNPNTLLGLDFIALKVGDISLSR